LAVGESHYTVIDGIRTHYLEAGSGPNVILLHSGEFGACAELSWEYLMAGLARHYRVVAPDLLGFGETDKVYDFSRKAGRQLLHLSKLLETISASDGYFIGNSMGGTMLLRAAADPASHTMRIRGATAVSGGGLIAQNKFRDDMVSFDGSRDGVVRMLQAMFHDDVWWLDQDYVDRRHQLCSQPGAWEAVAAARLRNPYTSTRAADPTIDPIEYERIDVPVQVIAGSRDRLREPGYGTAICRRIKDATCRVIPDSGHCVNIEKPAEVLALLSPQIRRVLAPAEPGPAVLPKGFPS
jgi:pimeloyl-ACP methyl ester carboxylesterase